MIKRAKPNILKVYDRLAAMVKAICPYLNFVFKAPHLEQKGIYTVGNIILLSSPAETANTVAKQLQ